MIINKSEFESSFLRLKPYLKKHEVTWIRRLQQWSENVECLNLDVYMEGLSNLRLSNFKSEVNFITKFVREFEDISSFQSRFWLTLEKPTQVKNVMIIPLEEDIRNSIPKLKTVEHLFLAIMISSGRRAADVRRIESSRLEIRETEVEVTIERDKTSSVPVTFSFSWDRSVFNDLSLELRNLARQVKQPFKNVSGQRLRRILPFSLHGCRNRRALKLIYEGSSIEETCSEIGWATHSSFVRYTRISLAKIRKAENFEEVVKTVNKILRSQK